MPSYSQIPRGIIGLCLIVTSACLCGLSVAEEQSLKSALVEGTWTHQGLKTILGVGNDTTITIKRADEHWTIAYEITHIPSVNDKGAKPRLERKGPYPLTVKNKVLTIKIEPYRIAAYTFLCDESRLIMPAFVEKKPAEWEYIRIDYDAGTRSTFSVSCEQDPFKVPVGKAVIDHVQAGRGFYSLEKGPRGGQALRFLERHYDEQGPLREIFRLIFDDYGKPRYEGHSRESYEQKLYLATRNAEQPKTETQVKKQ